ncbi:hypothetical protein K1719_010482 [Acacia pycnantha]|nr:hypothetical protein K1719_010482 [Acacia pycnantha]
MELSLVGIQNAGKTLLVSAIAVRVSENPDFLLLLVDTLINSQYFDINGMWYMLLMRPSLSEIPLLVLGNKIDKSEALAKQALVDQLYVVDAGDRDSIQISKSGLHDLLKRPLSEIPLLVLGNKIVRSNS